MEVKEEEVEDIRVLNVTKKEGECELYKWTMKAHYCCCKLSTEPTVGVHTLGNCDERTLTCSCTQTQLQATIECVILRNSLPNAGSI